MSGTRPDPISFGCMKCENALLGLILGVQLSLASWAVEPLRVGVAETDITRPMVFQSLATTMIRLAEGTIDPLKAKAMVFQPRRR